MLMKESYPCLLLLNDIHVSKDNIPAFTANWQEAIDICRKLDVREIAVGGDLFFSRAAQTLDVLLAVHDALLTAAEHGIHVTLAEGNHDKVNQEAVRGIAMFSTGIPTCWCATSTCRCPWVTTAVSSFT